MSGFRPLRSNRGNSVVDEQLERPQFTPQQLAEQTPQQLNQGRASTAEFKRFGGPLITDPVALMLGMKPIPKPAPQPVAQTVQPPPQATLRPPDDNPMFDKVNATGASSGSTPTELVNMAKASGSVPISEMPKAQFSQGPLPATRANPAPQPAPQPVPQAVAGGLRPSVVPPPPIAGASLRPGVTPPPPSAGATQPPVAPTANIQIGSTIEDVKRLVGTPEAKVGVFSPKGNAAMPIDDDTLTFTDGTRLVIKNGIVVDIHYANPEKTIASGQTYNPTSMETAEWNGALDRANPNGAKFQRDLTLRQTELDAEKVKAESIARQTTENARITGDARVNAAKVGKADIATGQATALKSVLDSYNTEIAGMESQLVEAKKTGLRTDSSEQAQIDALTNQIATKSAERDEVRNAIKASLRQSQIDQDSQPEGGGGFRVSPASLGANEMLMKDKNGQTWVVDRNTKQVLRKG
jgi:hypothetical protein